MSVIGGGVVGRRQLVEEHMGDYQKWAGDLFWIRDKENALRTLALNQVQQEIGRVEREELAASRQARLYILKGRQGGVSTDQQARALHLCMYTPGANALTLAHSREDTTKLFGITRRALREAVERYGPLIPSLGRSESMEVVFPGIDSHFWTGTAGARRIGRGVTLTRFHGSEFAFWDHPREVLNAVTPAMVPYGSVIVLETTPDAEGSEAHEFWREAAAGRNPYRTLFFPWWACDPLHYRLPLLAPDELTPLSAEEEVLQEVHHLSLEHLKWRRMKIAEMGKLGFIREYPEDADSCWVSGTGAKFYDADTLWTLLHTAAPTPHTSTAVAEGGVVEIYDDPTHQTLLPTGLSGTVEEDVIIGCDVAEGGGGDRSAWTARAFPSWRLLATYAYDRIEPAQLAHVLYHWGLEVFGEALLVVEKNEHGITVLRTLRDLRYPRRSIYHRTPLGRDRDLRSDTMGWVTSSESKPLLLDAGRALLRAAASRLVACPSRAALRDAWAVTDGKLTGRDAWMSELLAWMGREYAVRRRARVLDPLHW